MLRAPLFCACLNLLLVIAPPFMFSSQQNRPPTSSPLSGPSIMGLRKPDQTALSPKSKRGKC
ncbi:B3 domain-containing protein REM16-like [Gossypium australe]|uniref:B3 domain-containing protein REM16-like n=1 Tax=Gossypium australe TaxID=47621 RepID=A0A5B6VCY4_9ROSI|nr:B3 domain-containing protein REM16-like [Gossypium australe]